MWCFVSRKTFRRFPRPGLWLSLGALVLLAGCAGQTARMDPDAEDDTLIGVIGSKDFRSVCFQMAQSLVRIPTLQRSANPPTIAFTEVVNNSDELIEADDFMYKMRTELIKNTSGKLTFLDRDIVEQILEERRAKARGRVTASSDAPVYGVDYFLAGRIESIRRTRGRKETTYMRLSFRLTDAATMAIVWEDDYEIKKYRVSGVYDR